jgi:hypothetical protein
MLIALASGQFKATCVSTTLQSFCSQLIFWNPLFWSFVGHILVHKREIWMIYNLPSMDDLILASDDDGNNDDDDDKDGEAQLHIDVGGCSQFPDENIPKTF